MAIQEFDLVDSPLKGNNLIEASAGTGKTFTITGLFLRLLLEQNLEVDKILVVTFTEAATNELKERIRERLQLAKTEFAKGRTDDPFLQSYIKKFKNPKKLVPALDTAIRNFDEAAIHTIHGFCNKVLKEHAFESGGLFDTELVTEQTDLLKQTVEDFWRKKLYRESKLFVSYAISHVNPTTLFKLLAEQVRLLYLEIVPKVQPGNASIFEARFEQSFRQVKDLWQSAKEEAHHLLMTHPDLNRTQYKKTKIPIWIKALDSYASSDVAWPVLFDDFEKFTRRCLENSTKRNGTAPLHPFFDACEEHYRDYRELERIYQNRLISLKTEMFAFARQELQRRKLEKNVFFFDDLLLNLHAALNQEGEELAGSIRTKFKAALIDEFQDTDPVQYEIFKKIFGHDESILFLIGDPKQAIYGFRGADIFAYMRAKNEIAKQYTLSKNYRSDPGLITSINTIFENVAEPFVYHEIPFHKASAAEQPDRAPLRIAGESSAPFRLWFVDASKHRERGRALNKSQATELIIRAVASEVARLLTLGREKKALLGDRNLEEKDVAVLVRSNAEARQMQEALTAVNVHSVLYSAANLFDSDEAMEFERILTAVVEYKNARFLKAALATQIIGVSGEDLFGFVGDEAELEKWYDKFANYHKLWQEDGFMRMFKEFMIRENLLSRLMSYVDGERRITNILHLAEVLHQATVEDKLGMTGLLKWYSEQRSPGVIPIEQHQLRLESDENAVRLITMHMSKGLEYPVVFCPFTWWASTLQSTEVIKFHDEEHDRAFTLDLGSDQMAQHKLLAEKEALAENLRLLYVAVTRAKDRCYLVWGRFNQCETSAPAYLFHRPVTLTAEDIVHSLRQHLKNFNDHQYKNALVKMASQSNGTIQLNELPVSEPRPLTVSQEGRQKLTCREFTNRVEATGLISSYSSLISRHPHGSELADYDAALPQEAAADLVQEPELPEKFSTIFSFPKGARTGRFLHDVFQNLDFMQTAGAETEELVSSRLRNYGFENEWLPVITRTIQNVMSVPLALEHKSFFFSEIALTQRLNELEFYFPVKTLSSKKLKAVFGQYAGIEIPREFAIEIEQLNFAPFQGFMKGFIDLIFQHDDRFYIVDWKSNHLGNRVQAYDRQGLARAMAENLYILQYHIYAVALHQYLHLRLPDYDYQRHFGGIFYIFFRGVDPAVGPDFGIYKARPSANLINQLAEILLDV